MRANVPAIGAETAVPGRDAHVVHLSESEPHHRGGALGLLAVALAILLGACVWHVHREHVGLPAVAHEALNVAIPKWHTLEPVNEVVYGTRMFDTFGETFLLLAAVLAVGLVSRRRERRTGFVGEAVAGEREQEEFDPPATSGRAQEDAGAAEEEEQGNVKGPATPDSEPLGTPAPERAEAMTVVVRTSVRVIAPVLAIAGLYLAAWGFSPGGGFPAGAVILGVVLLAYVSLGYDRVKHVVSPQVIEPVEMAGALAIVVIALLGLVFDGSFTASFLPLGQVGTIPSGGTLQAFSAGELVEVSSGLVLAVFGLLAMEHDWVDEESPGTRA